MSYAHNNRRENVIETKYKQFFFLYVGDSKRMKTGSLLFTLTLVDIYIYISIYLRTKNDSD